VGLVSTVVVTSVGGAHRDLDLPMTKAAVSRALSMDLVPTALMVFHACRVLAAQSLWLTGLLARIVWTSRMLTQCRGTMFWAVRMCPPLEQHVLHVESESNQMCRGCSVMIVGLASSALVTSARCVRLGQSQLRTRGPVIHAGSMETTRTAQMAWPALFVLLARNHQQTGPPVFSAPT
jgi:hypothetical protein